MANERIFYKYCPWNNYAIENIKKHQLYPSKSINENDPFDNLPAFNRQDWIFEIHNKKKIDYKTIASNIDDYFDQYTSDVRNHTFIISLTKKVDNILMWSHYAENHTGICIEYDLSEYKNPDAVLEPLCKVDYSDKRIIWPKRLFGAKLKNVLKDEDLLQTIFKTMYTKATVWSYEDEYRIVSANEGNESQNIVSDCKILSVTIGARCDVNRTNEIVKTIKRINPNIKLYKMCIDKNGFALKRIEI